MSPFGLHCADHFCWTVFSCVLFNRIFTIVLMYKGKDNRLKHKTTSCEFIKVSFSFLEHKRRSKQSRNAGTHSTGLQRKGAAWKAGGDRLIDPLVKMGDIPPTSISIKPLRLEAFQGLLLFLFQGEPRKIYRQLMVSGRKALLEYIKSTYWKGESLPCELVCFSQRWGPETDGPVFEVTGKKRICV